MDKLRDKLRPIWNNYKSDVREIESRYKVYLSSDAKDTYSDTFINGKREEQNNEIDNLRIKYEKMMDDALEHRLKEFEPKEKIINFLEYQAKLSNTLSILEMSEGEVDGNILKFILEANDNVTFSVIKRKYEGFMTPLSEWLSRNDNSKLVDRIEKFTKDLKNNMSSRSISNAFGNSNDWDSSTLDLIQF